MPKVSVLLPLYNTDPAHLRAALDSVLAQTLGDFEFLIVNDGSTDARVHAVVSSYDDPRIVYTNNADNMGISRVRNLLLAQATGEYLAVMDHDDLCDPRRFELQVRYMDAHPDVGVCGTAHRRFGHLAKARMIRYPQDHADIRAWMFFKNVLHHPSAMMRRSVLEAHGLRYDEGMVSTNDRKLFMAIGDHARMANLPQVLCQYRMHAGMTSRNKRDAIVAEQKKLRREFLARMGANLDEAQFSLLNDIVMNGRARISDAATYARIEALLDYVIACNAAAGFLPAQAFARVCALYLVKRGWSAALRAGVPVNGVLAQTRLPVNDVVGVGVLRCLGMVLGRLKGMRARERGAG